MESIETREMVKENIPNSETESVRARTILATNANGMPTSRNTPTPAKFFLMDAKFRDNLIPELS